MAFDKLYEYGDYLAAEYRKREEYAYLYALVNYVETVLSNPKFKGQRRHCLKLIQDINEPFYKGYFNKK